MTTQAQRSDDRRQAILDAALALFAERGFHGTAVPLIAARAGCGAGTIYRHFESKERLVNVLYQHWKRAIITEVMATIPSDASPRLSFRHLWHRTLAFSSRNPEAMHFLELHHHGSYLDPESLAINAELNRLIRELCVRAQRELAVKDEDPSLLMGAVWGILLGVLRLADEGLLSLDDDTVTRAETLAWEAIRR
ncbi:MAG: TetR family transcriptional regulator [Haliangiales bacterium]